jgi:amidohydrolase
MYLTNVEIQELIELRRYFHQYPEVAFSEHKTGEFIADKLKGMGYKVTEHIGGTGVLAELKGGKKGNWVLLRTDIDALPMKEETDLPFSSKNDGIMHACGHDAHSAILLFIAKKLLDYKDKIKGGVKLLFQPAEETGHGALQCLKHKGLLDDPKVYATLALHVWQDLPVGTIAITSGPAMAGVLQYKIKVKGHGGHGAIPEQTIDPIYAAAQLISSCQSIVSRNVPPMDTGVVTFGSIHAGSAFNIIPDEVTIEGTARYYKKEIGDLIYRRLDEIIRGIDIMFGTQTEITYDQFLSPLVNDPKVCEIVRKSALEIYPDIDIRNDLMTMGGEDMSFFLSLVPGCFFFIGAGNKEKGAIHPHHNKRFIIDEDSIPIGFSVLFASTLNLLI